MFALSNNSRQRSQSHSHPQEYYALPSHLSLPFQDSNSRTFTGEHSRADLYPHPNEHSLQLYHSTERNISGLGYDNRESLSPTATFNQSYDRRTSSSSDPLVSPHISYHNHQQPHSGQLDLAGPAHLKRPDTLDNISLAPYHQPFLPEQHSASIAPASGNSEIWSGSGQAPYSEHPKPRKVRREKPRIELAPDQPPTTQGKPRARVYVACLQCRTRKIRCDGAKPVCHNCGRRTNGNSECNYDPIPKRRGPDKTPGARQRMARDVRNEIDKNGAPSRRRRRGRANSTSDSSQISRQQPQACRDMTVNSPQMRGADVASTIALTLSPGSPSNRSGNNTAEFIPVPHCGRSYSPECGCDRLVECPRALDVGGLLSGRKLASSITSYHVYDTSSIMSPYADTSRGYITEVDENDQEQQNATPEIGSEPSLTFTRKIWWDSLLSLYTSPTSKHLQVLSPSQRKSAAQSITSDIRFLFKASNYWFSFFHIPSFFGNFFDPVKRERIQPSLVLALLAMATFWQSSEVGYGREGRERALRFRDEAQAAIDASFNAGWIDETLAQAAWLLSLFEVCAHPRHSSERSTSSMLMLDSIIRSLSLTLVDADDPNATMFSPGTVPAVTSSTQSTLYFPDKPLSPASPEGQSADENGCSCQQIALAEHWPSAAEHAPLWGSTPAWDDSWTEGEIRKESCRRLCWSSMILAAGHISYTTAHCSQSLDLFISDPANYALLFSGESIAHSPAISGYSSKDTIWALHDRSSLLWHGCIRMRNNSHVMEDDKARFAVTAWLEADRLEVALNKHTCAIERAFIFQAREYIFNTRMYISYEFQRYVPLVTASVSGLFHRNKAEEWLAHQVTVAQRFMYGLHTITGNSTNLLARRPFFVFWFMGQIHRALSLWQCDETLTVALDVCKALIPAIDYLTALWPCPEQRHRYESLREKVANSCFMAGVEPPSPCDLSLPSPEALV